MKRNWKKTVPLLLAAILVFPGAVSAGAEDAIQVLIGGVPVSFDQPPEMMQDRVMVPIRAVSEALGCNVHWYENTQTIGIGRDNSSFDDFLLKVGYNRVLEMTFSNRVEKVTEIDQPPVVKNDRTLVPIRALSEALGAQVDWDAETQTVTVEPYTVDPELTFQDGVAIVQKGLDYGVQKQDGTMVLPVQYDGITRYGNLLLASTTSMVAKYTTVELFDLEGNPILEAKTDPHIWYAFGYLSVSWPDLEATQQEDGSNPYRYQVFDPNGGVVLKETDEAGYLAFQEESLPVAVKTVEKEADSAGLVKITVSTEDGDRYGFLNQDRTEIVIPCELEKVEPFSEGWAAFAQGDQWGYLNTEGTVVVQPQYESVGPLVGGRAAVQQEGKWGFLDTEGNIVIEPQFEEYGSYDAQSKEISVKQEGKWGVIDLQGTVIVPFQYDYPVQFQEDLASVCLDGVCGVINRNNEWVVQPQFDALSPFSNGVAIVEQYPDTEEGTSQYGVIDTSGNYVIALGKYSNFGVYGFEHGYVPVYFPAYGTNGIIDTQGIELECTQLVWP